MRFHGKLSIIAGVLMLAAGTTTVSAQLLWDKARLAENRTRLAEPLYDASYSALISRADSLLPLRPLSVTDKEKTAPSGDRHDYLSQARYFWPNPDTPDGLPYLNRDGVTNPEIERLDRIPLGKTAERVATLSLAYYFSGDERYADKAAQLLEAWFLDPATAMNPNLEYAQTVPGLNGGKGRCYGLLDAYSMVEMLDGVQLLSGSKAWTPEKDAELRKWFGTLARWMRDSPQGKEESRQANNHSTVYDAELAAFAAYGGDEALARRILSDVPLRRIATQIKPDGTQPEELWRTLSFGYSQYNLTHFLDMAQMARTLGVPFPLTEAPTEDSGSVADALLFLTRYAGHNGEVWPWQQISGKEEKEQELAADLYRASRLLGEDSQERASLMKAYYDIRRFVPTATFHLLYTDATPLDNAIAEAAPHLRQTIADAAPLVVTEGSVWDKRVTPYTVKKDGTLVMIDPNHWCSGFFPGTLWMMYGYTNIPYWREQAEHWSSLIEEAKFHKGTHDLGFMMYDSFGRGYDLTGDTHCREVVVQSAETLITRYSPKVGSIRSWDHNAEVWKYPVIIDNMMNLELLFRASELTGDKKFRDIAVRHADTTLRNHFRHDATSYHVVDYDPETGEVRMKCTAQGYADESVWSRGQAWGLYGFAVCYGYTGLERYLVQSVRIADCLLTMPDMPDDLVPYWDMKAPGVGTDPTVPRDASSAAIMASGLYLLADQLSDSPLAAREPEKMAAKADAYRRHADALLDSLTRNYLIPAGEKHGFLLDHSTGHLPANDNIDVPLNYADYYYLEALGRRYRK